MKRAAHPLQFFLELPPRNFWSFFGTQKAGHCARCSLMRMSKLGLRIVAWLKPCMFCEGSLKKIKFRAFPKRVSPRILSLESVDYFGASEHYWVVKKKKEESWFTKLQWSGVVTGVFFAWACALRLDKQHATGHRYVVHIVIRTKIFTLKACLRFKW